MNDLIILIINENKTFRCTSLNEARKEAIFIGNGEGRILVEITPKGGGLMMTMEFDPTVQDWIPVA